MAAPFTLPRLYPILDAGLLARAGIPVETFARQLREAGVRFLQYRDKDGCDEKVLQTAALLRSVFPSPECRLILNDRAALCRAAAFDGVHLGQEDMEPAEARALLEPGAVLGLSTHSPRQLAQADASPVDYLAIGPIYATSSKLNPDPVLGLDGLRAARGRTTKPLVAIGGITQASCRSVLGAGADSVSVISALLPGTKSTRELAKEFLLLAGG
jgi:thiamine-phosphate pyrophosphorylase